MKSPLLTLACTLIATASVAAAPRSTFKYSPPKEDGDDQRPVIVDATIGPQGSDFAMRLRFDKEPWGEACKTRCANATLFLDTDNNTTTGIQLGKKLPETGADMVVVIQGSREYRGDSSTSVLRVKVRQLTGEAKTVEEGEALADYDNNQDPERVQIDGNTVYLLIDTTGPTLPSGRKVRVVYHPPAAKALVATIEGMLSGGSNANVRIFRGSGSKKGWGRPSEAGTPTSTPNSGSQGISPRPGVNPGSQGIPRSGVNPGSQGIRR
ncbi:hypothetical protein [Hyalangium minutum]|uniref:Lipoprotein n=1 Tax=Hyalangium minutum TaxID=394096 RepID=A0A085W6K0_9BACT|nr:hypothetical protein [Hyalangium minutum]KFE63313.1 hypothetical protein DB31_2906 [Hyalangium minutum]